MKAGVPVSLVGPTTVPHSDSGGHIIAPADNPRDYARNSAPLPLSASGIERRSTLLAGPLIDSGWTAPFDEGGTRPQQRQYRRLRSMSDSASSSVAGAVVFISDGSNDDDDSCESCDDDCTQEQAEQQGADSLSPPMPPCRRSFQPLDGRAWTIRGDCNSVDGSSVNGSLMRRPNHGQGRGRPALLSCLTAIGAAPRHPADLPPLPSDFFRRCLLQQLMANQAGPEATRPPLSLDDSALEQVLSDLRPIRVRCMSHDVPLYHIDSEDRVAYR